MLTMGSLFDGIGGFPLAAVRNGIVPVWASEIEAFPIEVTKVRFPEMFHVGDITKLNGAALPPVDVICGGSPCQDLSVAGNRAGLAGERSGLFMDQVRIVKEMRNADGQRGIPAHLIRPRYMVWENVPGAFSSAEGEDFRAVLEEIVRVHNSTGHVPRPYAGTWKSAGGIVLGREFSLAWRVLDAQFWGVAQRRRRIFLVADFGGVTAPEILFKQDGLFGNSAPSRSEGQGATASAQGGVDDTSGACLTPWDVQSRRITDETGTWPALYGGEGGGHGYIQTEEKTATAFAANQRDEVRDLHDIASALGAQPGMKQQTFVAQEPLMCLNDQGGNRMDVTEEVTSTLRAGMGGHPPLVSQPNCLNGWDTQQSRVFMPEGVAPTLAGADGGGGRNPAGLLFAAAFCGNAGAEARGIGYQDECSPTLKTSTAPTVLCLNDQGGNQMHCTEDISGTLRAQEHGHQPLVFDNHAQDSRFKGPVAISQTVSAGFGMGGNNQPLVMATQQGGAEIGEGVCPTITASAGMSGNNQPVLLEKQPIAFSLDSKESNSMKSANPHSGCRETDTARTIDTTNPDPSKNQGGIAILQETICIAGNTIDRQPQNGGNGLGCQPDVAYTLTATDHHAVFNRQGFSTFSESDIAAAQCARQYKGNTDLISTYQDVVGALYSGDEKGIGNQYVEQNKCIVDEFGVYGQSQFGNYAEGCTTLRAQGGDNRGGSENLVAALSGNSRKLIRRLTPLECERLQGFPDGWTDIPTASDSARYKALGNSVAIPCVTFVMRGIAYFLRKIYEEQEDES
ncbi:MAG: DNA cytosine methyltransferase [Oscillospiraceae bacterium]|nr:DNA cytosine methyltransferase [Oscillospiraceae bacterium]